MGYAVKLALFLAVSAWIFAGIEGMDIACHHLLILCIGFQVSLGVSKVISGLLEAVISMKDVLSSATITNGELSVMMHMTEEMQLLFVVN